MSFNSKFVKRIPILAALIPALAFVQGCDCPSTGCPGGPQQDQQIVAARIDLTVTSTNVLETYPGGSFQMTFVTSFVGGPTSAVLSVTGLPAGVTATFSPATVTAGMTSTMTISAGSSAPVGPMAFTVTAAESGTNFGVNASQSVLSQIKPPFTLAFSGPTSATAGTAEDYQVTVTRANGFTGAVALSIVPSSVPVGSTVVFTPSPSNSQRSDVRINFGNVPSQGLWLVRTVGVSGSIVDTVALGVRIGSQPVPPDITLGVTPASITVVPGGSANFDLPTTSNAAANALGNIAFNVSGVPNGANATIVVPPIQGALAQLRVTTTTSIPDGTYPLTVTATLGSLVRSATATLVVATPPDFSLSLNPASLTIARNATGQTTLGIQRTGPVTGVTIDLVSPPAGVTLTSNPTAITGLSSALMFAVSGTATPGTYPITVRGTAGTLTRTTTLTLTIPAPPPSNVSVQVMTPNATVTTAGTVKIPVKITRINNAIGQTIELRTTGVPVGGTAWIAPAFVTGDTATLYVVGGIPGTARIVVSAAYGAIPPSDIANVTVNAATAPDFSIAPTVTYFEMAQGVYHPKNIDIVRTNGFTGAVSFTAVGDLPGQYQFRFSPAPTTGSATTMEIYASPNVPEGLHSIIIRGTSGNIVREVAITIWVNASSYYPYPGYPFGIKKGPP